MLNQPTNPSKQATKLKPQTDGVSKGSQGQLKRALNVHIMVVFYSNPKNKMNITVSNDINK